MSNNYVVYICSNCINKKKYIGITKNFRDRVSQHKHAAFVKKIKYPFYSAIRKYGFENFIFNIVRDNLTMEDAVLIEKELIKEYKSIHCCYNIAEGGIGIRNAFGEKNSFYGKKHSEKTKEVLRRINIGKKIPEEVKKRISNSNKGRKCSSDTKIKMGKAKKEQWEDGRMDKEKYKNIWGKHRKGVKSRNSIIFCNENGKEYLSILDACRDLGVHSTNVSRHLRGESTHVKGYTFILIKKYYHKNNICCTNLDG